MNKFRVFRVYSEKGRIEGRLETGTLEGLSPGEVTLRAEYSSVNYKDALAATGAGKVIRHFPLIAGIDVAGHVVSSEDPRFSENDAVLVTGYDLGVDHDGGYAEYVRVPAEWVVPLPPGMSTYQAMALGTAGLTVALCIHRLECNGQTPAQGPFVVTGATGGVGMLAIDILARKGYEVIALTGKPDQDCRLKELGAAQIMDRHSLKFDGPALEKAQWGGAIDNVGGDILAWLTRTMRPWGNIVAVGLAGGSELHTTVMPFILRGVSLLGVTSSGCPTALRQQLWKRLAGDLAPAHLDRIVTRVAALDDLPAIFADMLAGKTTGRTVIKISDQ
jgi:NADPH2:quinone reductase